MKKEQEDTAGAKRWAWIFLGCAWASLAFFQIRFLSFSEDTRITYIPDDGFYYFQTARHFFELHRWSFDQGLSVTSGFHPAWAYFLALQSLFFKAPSAALWAGLASGCVLVQAGAVFSLGLVRKDAWGLLVLALFLSSVNVAFQSVSLMEWPLAVLAAGAYAWQLSRSGRERGGLALFFLGFIGSWARTDFGLLPACFFMVASAQWILKGASERWRPAAYGLAGAASGLLGVFAHNYYFTGTFLQGSVASKLHFVAFRGHNGFMAGRTLLHLLTGYYLQGSLARGPGVAWRLAVLATLASLLLFFFWKFLRPAVAAAGDTAGLFFWTAVAALGAYHALYSYGGTVQLWYTSSQVIPLALLLYVGGRALPSGPARSLMAAVIAALIVWNIASLALRGPLYSNQAHIKAGHYLQQHPEILASGRIASWNAGVFSYLQGGNIINIDGLINNDVLPSMNKGQLACYLSKMGVRYIVDDDIFDSIFTTQMGIGDGCVKAACKRQQVIGQEGEGFKVMLFELDPEALKRCCTAP